MPEPTKSPAAVVRQHADLRILGGEVEGLARRISQHRRNALAEINELGVRLIRAKKMLSHGDYGPWCKDRGISTQDSSDAVRVAMNWSKVPERGSLVKFLKACNESLLVRTAEEDEADISAGADAIVEPETEAEAEPAESAAPIPPPDIGDAYEGPLPESLLDAEGDPLPPSAKTAFEDKSIEGWIEKYGRPAFDALKALRTAPSTVHTNLDALIKKQSAISRMLKSSKPSHRCYQCKGLGCEKCKNTGWMSKAVWSEQFPKAVKKPFFGRRQ